MANRRDNGNRIAKTTAEVADREMKKAMKSSGFRIVDEKDRVSTVKTSIESFKHDQKNYNKLLDSSLGNLKRTKLPTR